MPLSPLYERFTIDDDGVERDVCAIVAQRFGPREIVLLLPADVGESPDPDTDAWIFERVEVDGEPGLVPLEDDDLIDRAWAHFDEQLALLTDGTQDEGAS